ncbi:hypothetical protein H4582DRAFT_2055677 [Lactarius indigo]|nr:hypothetical protein H4582DRAFT_2055677 [Lactarius indigo]
MATTNAVTSRTRPLPQQATGLAPPSCCHKQRHATRSQSESSPRTASTNDDQARPTRSSASESPSRMSSPTPSTSSSSPPPPSPPESHLLPVPRAEAKEDPDGTISPATIYQHYACVARRLFPVLAAERQRRVANPRRNPTASAETRLNPQVQATVPAPRALDWPLPTSVGPAPTLALDDVTGTTTTMVALDELPVSANCSLPEYQLTQEWFERIVSDLREAEESKAATAGAGGEDEAEHRRHQK